MNMLALTPVSTFTFRVSSLGCGLQILWAHDCVATSWNRITIPHRYALFRIPKTTHSTSPNQESRTVPQVNNNAMYLGSW